MSSVTSGITLTSALVSAGDTSGDLVLKTTPSSGTAVTAMTIAGSNQITTATGFAGPLNGTVGATTPSSGAFTTLTSSSDATLSGLTVGKGAGSVSTNTAVGASALAANTSGLRNVAVGFEALISNTSGARNAASGYEALRANTTGDDNAASGNQSLRANTTGANNAAFGGYSLYTNTTGASNVAVGTSALQNSTTASNNTAVGYQAGYSNTTGTQSVAVGQVALYSNTTGINNSGFGQGSLQSSTTGNHNTAIGQSALNAATTGSSNTAVGRGSGAAITTGSSNSILGRYDGNQGGLDIRTANNYIVLSDGDGNPRFVVNGSGEIEGSAVATQAQQETGSSTGVIVTPGRQQYHPSAAKVWAYVNGAGTTIHASYGVGSITDLGAGQLRLNFSTSFSGSYSGVTGINQDGVGMTICGFTGQGTSSVILYNIPTSGGSPMDPGGYEYAAFGDQ